jgi:hypothetical protein
MKTNHQSQIPHIARECSGQLGSLNSLFVNSQTEINFSFYRSKKRLNEASRFPSLEVTQSQVL